MARIYLGGLYKDIRTAENLTRQIKNRLVERLEQGERGRLRGSVRYKAGHLRQSAFVGNGIPPLDRDG